MKRKELSIDEKAVLACTMAGLAERYYYETKVPQQDIPVSSWNLLDWGNESVSVNDGRYDFIVIDTCLGMREAYMDEESGEVMISCIILNDWRTMKSAKPLYGIRGSETCIEFAVSADYPYVPEYIRGRALRMHDEIMANRQGIVLA